MTSSNLPAERASSPQTQTGRSSGSFGLSLSAAGREKSELLLKKNETERVLSALSLLGAFEGPQIASFSALKHFEDQHDCLHIARILDATWYLPRATTKAQVKQAAATLAEPGQDNGHIRAALYQLWLTTKHEKLDVQDREAMLATYVQRLTEYPTDMVLVAIGNLSATAKFFPAWADIQGELDRLTGPRAALLGALRHILKKLEN